MLNFLQKIIFWFKKPKIIIVIEGEEEEKTFENIYQILNQYFLKGKTILGKNIGLSFLFRDKVLIFNSKIKEIEKLKFLIKQSSQSILAIVSLEQFPINFIKFNSQLFAGTEKGKIISSENFDKIKEQIIKIDELISPHDYLILNLDDRINKKLKEKIKSNCLSFGFQEGTDIQVSDLKTDNNKINFKINYKGNIVPIWLENFNKKQIYSILASITVALIFNFNLVEISQSFKYRQQM